MTWYNFQTGELEPKLATEWAVSDDGTTWTFKLREGVKFHDGTEMDADAVKFSIERTRDGGQGYSFLWAGIKSIDTPDPYTVVFNLESGQPLDLMMASSIGAYIISPTAIEANGDEYLQSHDAGTGPYMLKSFVEAQEVTLVKFEDYWGAGTASTSTPRRSSTFRRPLHAGSSSRQATLVWSVRSRRKMSLCCRQKMTSHSWRLPLGSIWVSA